MFDDLHFTSFSEIIDAEKTLDTTDVLERAKTSNAVQSALEMFRLPNWWASGIKPERILAVAAKDGIPLAWVPGADLVRDLVRKQTRQQRVALLLAREADISLNCIDVAHECDDPWLQAQQPLALCALDSWRSGHAEAAMALAVNLAEMFAHRVSHSYVTAFESHEAHKRYDKNIEKRHSRHQKAVYRSRPGNRFTIGTLIEDVTRAPIVHFFSDWMPDTGDEPPHTLNRHYAIHEPTVDHYSKENGILALMLMTSLMRHLQERYVSIKSDHPDEYN